MESIQTLMEESAQDAVNYANENYEVVLDYSFDSVKSADAIVQLLSDTVIDDQTMFTLSYIFGAYLGEVYRREREGEWLYVEATDSEPPQTFFKHGEKTFALPSKVYHVLNGSSDETLTEYMWKLFDSSQTH
ncbi:hypothetical protein DBZ36_04010 [Alginatibacterium sediminis]|uniref:DUF3806 domain-containing protein n=1 Tax=Alginatibacterium sediminis TaxID=2164068 RepID=A0A420EG48_9ALTE|nr:hypothetical protein [Alginatibacterium sediminis]RKF19640.1 hypothetical protein DBZ36_04010 [Alginatibacterium sediminis]